MLGGLHLSCLPHTCGKLMLRLWTDPGGLRGVRDLGPEGTRDGHDRWRNRISYFDMSWLYAFFALGPILRLVFDRSVLRTISGVVSPVLEANVAQDRSILAPSLPALGKTLSFMLRSLRGTYSKLCEKEIHQFPDVPTNAGAQDLVHCEL